MKQTTLLLLIIVTLIAGITLGARRAQAAKLTVVWTAPTQNTDGSPLTDLTGYRIEWGSCVNGGFGTYQAGINVGAAATSAPIYPTKLSPVCVRIFAINTNQVFSAPAETSYSGTPSTLGKPVQ